ncbi:uncharacterized protein LOC115594723 [Sparus aurata]|uniref:uncharacterized protein LOC115594723 n=1 Tax=Sparus aurata TaxID=8175 RepID=UPI0011C14B80|nr:uncharacterized protein LOC115594723 [Sparus aurata]
MPKKSRRSVAAKERWKTHPPCSRAPVSNAFGSSPPAKPFWSPGDAEVRARWGTGYRHPATRWPPSEWTGRSHKLVIPPESDKKFVLIVGDSHLRSIVDGFVVMPEGKFSFGFMSTPGAHAAQLRTEVLHAEVPRSPDAVCVLAPSNNLTASRTVDEAAVDYARFLTAVRSRWPKGVSHAAKVRWPGFEPGSAAYVACVLTTRLPARPRLTAVRSRWPKVFVLDFPPRLNEDEKHQKALRHEYHRVTARMGLRYFSAEEYFPRTRLDLWSTDGVHLSDREGMGILTQLLWTSTEQFLATPPPPSPVSPTPSQPLRKFSPKLVVKGEVRAPLSPDPFQWKVVGQSSKSQVPSQASVAQQQEKESFLPLNPMWFSSTALRATEEVSPSQLSDVPSPPARKVASPVVARRRRTTERRPPRSQSPVNNLVGSPPARLSRRLEDDAPSSPVPWSRTTDGSPPAPKLQ